MKSERRFALSSDVKNSLFIKMNVFTCKIVGAELRLENTDCVRDD